MAIELLEGPWLKKRTTLRLGGKAIAEVVLHAREDFDELPPLLARLGGAPLVLGRGSNILAKDGELPLVIITPAFNKPCEVVAEDEDSALLKVQSYTALPFLLSYLAANGLSGLEGLSGIPGTVGGAIAMNAGSYGDQFGQCIEELEVFSPENGLQNLGKSDFKSEYRHFSFAGMSKSSYYIFVSATLRLLKGNSRQIQERMQACLQQKKATQPLAEFSAGCAFCNPADGVSAGVLLDRCGFKGKTIGEIKFSEIHANFLVNKGNGNSEDALSLIQCAKESVYKEFGYNLKLEIKVYP